MLPQPPLQPKARSTRAARGWQMLRGLIHSHLHCGGTVGPRAWGAEPGANVEQDHPWPEPVQPNSGQSEQQRSSLSGCHSVPKCLCPKIILVSSFAGWFSQLGCCAGEMQETRVLALRCTRDCEKKGKIYDDIKCI